MKTADSKSGGEGNNYPDIQILLENQYRRSIPVMIEAKGSLGKLEKLDKDNQIIGITYYEEEKNNPKTGEIIHKIGEVGY